MRDRDDVRRLMGHLGTPVEAYQVFSDEAQSASLSRWALLEGVSKAGRTGTAHASESREQEAAPQLSQLVAHLARGTGESVTGTAVPMSYAQVEPVNVRPATPAERSSTSTENRGQCEPTSSGTLFKRPQPAVATVEAPSQEGEGNGLKHLLKKIGA